MWLFPQYVGLRTTSGVLTLSRSKPGTFGLSKTFLFLVYLNSCLIRQICTAVPLSTVYVNVTEIFSHRVSIQWTSPNVDRVTHFTVNLKALNQPDPRPRVIANILANQQSVLIDDLYPSSEYQLFVELHHVDDTTNRSDVITFTTTAAIERYDLTVPGFQMGEVILVLLVLSAWVAAFAMFLHYWAKIRFTQPGEPRFQRTYKNLDTIKIVKKNTDMVIYKSYTKELSKTMIAREKRLQRMSTMPNIKVCEKEELRNYKHHGSHMLSFGLMSSCMSPEHAPDVERFRTLPVIEVRESIQEETGSSIDLGKIDINNDLDCSKFGTASLYQEDVFVDSVDVSHTAEETVSDGEHGYSSEDTMVSDSDNEDEETPLNVS